ncbi:DNA repair protein [Croceibacterium mercuriale]|uniref:Non-homologous end joining protein Ku n=1 Tax=Croceibacterium mercuriale TaxID=1572751 RepID=A0A0B2BS64_9SPHN|nr:Ku protein [Croceibacterium mercuriale]KHL24433.1 DNA repair protein [Croceibacterium mercuriale]
MAARAYWQGQIRLALVSIPVEIYSAVKSGAKISFNQIHEPTGKRVHYEKVVEGVGPIDLDEIIKGYEISKGNYVLLDDEEIESVKIESRKTLELVQFVEAHEIDPLYFEKPYYVAPQDDLAEEAFVVLREALRRAGKVALGQLSIRGKEQLVAIKPCGKGLLMETLRYADEVRGGQSFFSEIDDVKPDAELLDLATTLIDKKTAPFDAKAFHDNYADALMRLIEKKAKSKTGKKIVEDPDDGATASKSNVIDLMAALKKSVGSGAPAKETTAEKKPAAKKAPAKKSTAAAKKPATPRTRKSA